MERCTIGALKSLWSRIIIAYELTLVSAHSGIACCLVIRIISLFFSVRLLENIIF